MRIDAFERVARLVGNTPLVEISQALTPARILAKLEYYNPSGSVKDRAAKGMLEAALANEELAGRTILEATSGNTGIALAMFGSALGLPVELVMPANVTPERKRIIANYGARSVFTSNLEGTDGAQRKAAELAAAHPERYFYPDQYNNEHNWRAHYGGTGRRSGARAAARRPTSWPAWAPAAPSSAAPGSCASAACAASPCSRTIRSTGWRAGSTCRRRGCPASTTPR